MLTGSVLHYVDVNNFEEENTLHFIANTEEELVIRLKQPTSKVGLRYVPNNTATLEVKLPKKDGTILTKVAGTFADDRSIWAVELTAEETASLAGGNIWFSLTEDSKIIGGYIPNGLSLVITGGC